MKTAKIRLSPFVFLFLIVVLGLLLRNHNLYTWPREGATFDEYAWTWLGINLIQKQTPISWSSQPQYKNREHLVYRGAAFFLVKPYLEHPPFFGLVAGSFALLNGARDMYDVDIKTIRPLAIILGLASIILVFLLTKELYDKRTAFFASLLYATVPTVVVGSRIVQNENFFIPMWLLALLFTSKYLKNKNSLYRNTAAVICGLLILSKIPWITAAGSIIIIFLYLKKYKDLFKFVSIVIPIGLLYLVYGLYWDAKVFIDLWGLQLNRYDISFASIYALFQKTWLVDRFFLDGWIYFGWFAFILLLIDIKKHYFIIFALLSYFVIFLTGIPDEAGHGWYRYPFYPFLIISIALFIKEYFAKNWVLSFLFLVFVGTTLFQNTWVVSFGFSYFIFRLIILGWGLSLIPLFLPFKPFLKFSRVVTYSWLVIFILFNIWSVMLYNEQ